MSLLPLDRSKHRLLLLPLVVSSLGPPSVQAGLVLNEIHPDPAGSDGGREFVEILNTGPGPQSLDGVVLAFANGATGGPWEIRWTGDAGVTLEPGSRFLITDRNWNGGAVPDVEVWLGLQNGPDALRLESGGGVLDLVGYGALTDGALMETEAAVLDPGRSLARRPDGRDTGNNKRDFTPATPTPGQPNFQPHEWTVDGWSLDPPSLDRPGLPVVLTIQLRNTGTETQPLGPAVLKLGQVETTAILDRTEPDQVRTLVFGFVPLAVGSWALELWPPAIPGVSQSALYPTRLQVGPARILVNEVLSRPGDGQGEWVELLGTGPEGVELDGLALEDADGARAALPPVRLEPGQYVVLAQDSLGLSQWMAENEEVGVPRHCSVTGPIHSLSGWPTLNNSAPGDRDFADRVMLVDSTGAVLDHVTLEGGGLQGTAVPDGRSVERMAPRPVNPGFANWAACGAPVGSTPGCPNSVRQNEAAEPGLTAEPRILDPAGGAHLIHFRFDIPPGFSGWRLLVFDLGGSLVRDLGGDDLGSGPRDLIWDGRDDHGGPAGSGGYVAVLDRHGVVGFGERTLVVVR